ncbi:MAG: hypothetical protein AAGG46_12385 [Planctomycetota bacterium]
MREVGRGLSFDAGIEQILTRNDTQSLNLPKESQTLPGDGLFEQRLTEVLTPPSVEQELIESFRPEITNRDVLTPVGYQSALKSSRGKLEQLAKRLAAEPDQSAVRDAVRKAVERLDDELVRHDLISTYRNLLVSA